MPMKRRTFLTTTAAAGAAFAAFSLPLRAGSHAGGTIAIITLHDSGPRTFADGEFGAEDRYAVIGSEAAAKLVEAGPEPRLGTIAVVFSGGVF